MTTPSKQNQIKHAVERKLIDMLRKGAEKPSKEELQVSTLAVKYLAVAAKLDEADFGKDLDELTEDVEPEKTDDE